MIRPLNTAKNVVSQSQRLLEVLQREGVLRGTGHPKEVVYRSGGQDEEVVGNLWAVGFHNSLVKIDSLHLSHGEPGVGYLAQDSTHRVGDVPRLQFGRSDLVEQWQEGMVVVAVHKQHVHGRPSQRAGGPQATEAGPQDYHSRFVIVCHRFPPFPSAPPDGSLWFLYLTGCLITVFILSGAVRRGSLKYIS